MTNYEISTLVVASFSAVVAIIVARATKALVDATKILALETANMASAMSTAHVVVTLKAHDIAQHIVEAVLENTGTTTAYDILIEHSSIPSNDAATRHKLPFHKISILKPHDVFKSCMYIEQPLNAHVDGQISTIDTLINCVFTITISWSHAPTDSKRYSHTYELSVRNLGDLGKIREPLASISDSLSKIEKTLKDIPSFTKNTTRLNVDIFDSVDRKEELKERQARWIKRNRQNSRR